MKGIVLAFILGAAAGVWGYRYFEQEQSQHVVRVAETSVVARAEKVTEAIKEKVNEIRAEDIKRELEHSGLVIREKARQATSALSDVTANARTTAAVKTKLFAEPNISSMSINVDSSDGLVTLSGTVASHEQIARAVRITLDTEGVEKVISTLQVKAK
jgi:hyperosmotically inducible protein